MTDRLALVIITLTRAIFGGFFILILLQRVSWIWRHSLSEHSWHAQMGFGSHPGEYQTGFKSDTAETTLRMRHMVGVVRCLGYIINTAAFHGEGGVRLCRRHMKAKAGCSGRSKTNQIKDVCKNFVVLNNFSLPCCCQPPVAK